MWVGMFSRPLGADWLCVWAFPCLACAVLLPCFNTMHPCTLTTFLFVVEASRSVVSILGGDGLVMEIGVGGAKCYVRSIAIHGSQLPPCKSSLSPMRYTVDGFNMAAYVDQHCKSLVEVLSFG